MGVGCHSLLQEIFLTQGLNSGLLHCRQILYHLSHQGSPVFSQVLTDKLGKSKGLVALLSLLYTFLWLKAAKLASYRPELSKH